jgi:hypothetical protein
VDWGLYFESISKIRNLSDKNSSTLRFSMKDTFFLDNILINSVMLLAEQVPDFLSIKMMPLFPRSFDMDTNTAPQTFPLSSFKSRT